MCAGKVEHVDWIEIIMNSFNFSLVLFAAHSSYILAGYLPCCPERGLTGSSWIKDTNFFFQLDLITQRNTAWLNLHDFTTHRIFFFSSALMLLHVTEFPLVFILCPPHLSLDCRNTPSVWVWPPLTARFVLSLTLLSWLATCQFGWCPLQRHLDATMTFIACRCGLLSWGNTQEFVPASHSWSEASPAAVASQLSA